jgi:hypothetical protein
MEVMPEHDHYGQNDAGYAQIYQRDAHSGDRVVEA